MHNRSDFICSAPTVTEPALNPWVSVDSSGQPIATFTPVVTTVNGVPITINPLPPTLTVVPKSNSISDDRPTKTTDASQPTETDGGSFQVCHNKDGRFAPFCKPDNGSSIYVGDTYYGKLPTLYIPIGFTGSNTSGQLHGIPAFSRLQIPPS